MDNGAFGRKNRLIKQKKHDTYRLKGKLPEPSLCNTCGALYVNGRWTWAEPPEKSHPVTCSACRRIEDQLPAGVIKLQGFFLEKHRQEILNLVRNTEKLEKNHHPLERIMGVAERDGFVDLQTTGVHLARRIGEALSRSYQGDYSIRYGEDEQSIRIQWQRD